MTDQDMNPRGFKRPHDGRGGGVGVGGLRGGRNTEPCSDDGVGGGEGKGRGKGKGRK